MNFEGLSICNVAKKETVVKRRDKAAGRGEGGIIKRTRGRERREGRK